MSGYPPPQGQPGGYPPPQQQQPMGYPPQGQPGGYPPPQGQPGGYPPPQGQPGGYPPPQGQPGGYPPPQGQPGGYPPPQGQPGGYPPPQGQPGGYPPPQGQVQPAWQPGQGGPPHKWDNLPAQPLVDNPNDMEPDADRPHWDDLAPIQGYDHTGFGQVQRFQPPPPPPPPQMDPPEVQFLNVANLSEEECRQAMLEFVAQNCCYGKGCAEDHKITKIAPSSALHYTLETFTESRTTGMALVPYGGGHVDGPEYGPAPGPWQIPCNPNDKFSTHTIKLPVPHTDQVKRCHNCHGRGFNRCWKCGGDGRVRCSSCGGNGRRHDGEHCSFCGGDGRRRCGKCGGDGRVTCRTCSGYGQVKVYVELTVEFVNHFSDYIIEETDMPDELVREVKGISIFNQELPQVWPLTSYPTQSINQNSIRLVDMHRNSWNDERKLGQRHELRVVPVSEVAYEWKDLKTRYWVYGTDHKVHSPDYPQTCCWGCEIL